MRVAFRTLGCKVNRVESEEIASTLLGSGVTVTDEHSAEVIVVNTCTVTGEADAKARKAVRHALAAVGSPVVVVTGCLASLDAEGLRALGPRVVVEPDKGVVAARVAEALGSSVTVADVSVLRSGEGFRTRVPLKIQDGCDAFCSYCIVPFARGVPRSVPLAEVVSRAQELVDDGAAEIVLTGINLGRYSDAHAELSDVVAAVAATGIRRLRLSSIEPMHLTERLLGVLESTPAVCAHLHVPLQSGSDAVLSSMGRGYTVEEFAERLRAARSALPGVAITTDVIAGFPGESEDDAADTLRVCEELGFTKLHVFRYSERAGTAATELADPVAPQVRAGRAAALRELSASLQAAHADAARGRSVEVLVERVESGRASGTTREHLSVEFVAPPGIRVGDVVTVTA